MFKLKKAVSIFCIVILLVSITGCSSSHIVSTSLVKDVVKDVAKDEIKEQALSSLYGVDTKNSLSSLFSGNKFSQVSDKKQGFFKSRSKNYYSEVYYLDSDSNYVYIGDRYKNLPNNVNFKWSRFNATDFEIGTYKKGIAYNNTYIAYDSESATLVLGECKKGKLVGKVVIYDAYNDTLSIKDTKSGKVESYNDSVKLNDSVELSYLDSKIIYKSNTCSFEGTPFKFKCTYKYDDENSISFDYTVLQNIEISQTDGTTGELKIVESDNSKECKVLSDYLVDLGLKSVSKLCMNTIEAGFPAVKILDVSTEVLTGEDIEDRLTDLIKNGFKTIQENDIVDKAQNKVNEIVNGKDKNAELKDKSYDDIKSDLEKRGIEINFD